MATLEPTADSAGLHTEPRLQVLHLRTRELDAEPFLESFSDLTFGMSWDELPKEAVHLIGVPHDPPPSILGSCVFASSLSSLNFIADSTVFALSITVFPTSEIAFERSISC